MMLYVAPGITQNKEMYVFLDIIFNITAKRRRIPIHIEMQSNLICGLVEHSVN